MKTLTKARCLLLARLEQDKDLFTLGCHPSELSLSFVTKFGLVVKSHFYTLLSEAEIKRWKLFREANSIKMARTRRWFGFWPEDVEQFLREGE